MRVGTARRIRARILRRALSIATALVLVATSITIPSVAASTAVPASQGGTPSSAAATNQMPSVTAAPTLPLKFVDSTSGVNVSVRPAISIPASPKVKTEVASARTQYSRTYANPNGKYTVQSGPTRMNYKDTSGAWQPIDTTLVAAPTGSGWDFTETANDKQVRISNSNPAKGLAQLSLGSYTITLRVPGATSSTPGKSSTSASSLTSPAGAFTVTPTPDGFEFSATLADASAPTSYAFALNTGGLVASLEADGQTIDLTDPKATDPTAIVGSIGAPSLFDATSAFAPTSAVTVTLTATDASLQQGETLITYALDKKWLAAKGRTYPITLDPPVCIQVGSSTCTKNAGSDAVAALVNNPLDARESQSLFWFSMYALQDGAVISSATLDLEKASGDAGQATHAFTNLAGFASTVTWATKPATPTTPGSNGPVTGAGISPLSFDVSDIVRAWYSRGPDFMSNFGVTVKQDNLSANPLRIYGNSASPVSYRPKLTINYDLGAYTMGFDPNLGDDYAPTTTMAGGQASVPVTVTNTSAATWASTQSPTADYWSIGYRWYDAKGNVVPGVSGKTALPAVIAPGGKSDVVKVQVATPAAGQYTLRLDMVHTLGTKDLWLADWARKDLYMARAKASSSPSNAHWGGTSVIEREEYPIAVVAPSGGGERKSVSLPDGGSLAINIWSGDISYSGAGGVGFADLGTSVGLSYGYTASETGSIPGVLGGKGWYSNVDERFEPGSGTADYTYRSASGTPSLISANADGQLLGGPGRVDRPRITFFDENLVPGTGTNGAWTGTPPVFADLGAGAFSGTKVLRIASNNTGTDAPATAGPTKIPVDSSSPPINLNVYSNLLFQVKTDSDTGAALGMYVTDKTTGVSKWFFYTVGANWTIGGGSVQKNIPTSPVGTWVTVGWTAQAGADTQNDVAVAFGVTASDVFSVSSIRLLGRGGSGNTYFDDIRFEGRISTFFDTMMPTWTANGGAASTAADHDPSAPVSDTFAIQVAAGGYSAAPDCSNCYYGANRFLGLGLNPFPFARWSWKKSGGNTIAVTFHVQDARTSVNVDITYYAGPMPPAGAPNPIQVSPSVPVDWTPVTRNLLEDARSAFGFYNAADVSGTSTTPSSAPAPDPVSMYGFRLIAGDGAYGLFDLGTVQTMPNAWGAQNGLATGDDFILTMSGGETHRFNRDGVLTRILDANGLVDANAKATRFTYTYDTSAIPTNPLSTGSRYTLTSILAPSDGMTLAGSATVAVRRINVTHPAAASCGLAGAASCVRFTEALGSGTDSGTYTEFDLDGNHDLVAVVPARWSAACATSGASGCAGFVYDTAHRLTSVQDPRYPGASADHMDITWTSMTVGWNTTQSLVPSSIKDGSDDTRLKVVSFGTGTGGKYQRVAWQDAGTFLATTVRFADLNAGGSTFEEYAPVVCDSGGCAGTTPGSVVAINQSDGDSNFSGEIRLRTSTSNDATPPVSCLPANLNDYLTGLSNCGDPVVSRRGSYAAYALDNYSDPLTGGLTAWSQSANQFAASVASKSADRYRTTFVYNALGQTTDTITPALDQTSTYASQIAATAGLAHFYRLADTGSTLTDSVSSGAANGTFSGSPTKGVAGSLVGDSNGAMGFSPTGYATSSPAAISGTFSVEAAFKLDTGYDKTKTLGILGSRSPSDYGFDVKLMPNGLLHADIGDGTTWLTTYADAKLPYAADNWYQVVYVVSPTGYSIYVNGVSIGAGSFAATPRLFDASHKLYIGWTGMGTEYWQGSLDEISIYTSALTPRQIAAHYAAAGSVASEDQQVVYDSAGNATQALDNFLANPGFESLADGWTTSGGSISTNHYPDPGTVNQRSMLLPVNATVSQIVSLVPGQKFRLQAALQEAAASGGRVKFDYQRPDGSWTSAWQTVTDSGTAWHQSAWDVNVPMEATGQVKVTFTNAGTATGYYVDDVALFTTYKATSYDTHGLVQTVTEVSGASGSNATTVSNYDYGAASAYATNLLANGGFASGTSGWTLTGTATTPAPANTETLRDGNVSGFSLAGPWGSTAKVTLPSGSSATVSLDQAVSATAGQSYSASGLVANGGLTSANLRLEFKTSLGAVVGVVTAPSTAKTGGTERSGWAYQTLTAIAPTNAATIVVSIVGTGAGASFYADEVRLVASGTPAPYVADTSVTPAIFATRITRNVVSGGTAPDQNAASVSAYDRWGRAIVSIDPDGIGTMTQYASNATDVAASSDGLGNVSSTTSWDEVGNVKSIADPTGVVTNTTYSYSAGPTDVTTADGTLVATTSHTEYDAAGRAIHTWANYSGGGSPKTDDKNLETTLTYDSNGRVTEKVVDDGGINATSDTTYDLAGNVLTTKVWPGPGGTGTERKTTSHFDKAGSATGTQAPISPTAAPAPLCPDSTTVYCNSVAKKDLSGNTIESIDAYGVIAHTWFDIGGHAVRTISNYKAGLAFTSEQNVTADIAYDLGGRPLAAAKYLIPCGATASYTVLSGVPTGCVFVANTAYDALGRSLSVVNPDSSWTHTVYTKAGRTDRMSRPGGTGDTDSTVAWTRNLYDAAGRQTTTISDYDTTGHAGIAIDGFEGDSGGWDAGGSASFLTGGASTISLDAGSGATVHAGMSSLLVAASASQGAEWTLPGTFQATHTYKARMWVYAAAGASITARLGTETGDSAAPVSNPSWSSASWQQVDITWQVGSGAPAANAVKLAVINTGSATSFRIDDVSVWETAPRSALDPNPANVPGSVTVFDARGKVIESIAPPSRPGDPTLATTSAYDALGRPTSVTVDANVSVSGNGSGLDTNLTTTTAYDDLGRATDKTDPNGHLTHAVYDRMGNVIETDVAWNETTLASSLGIKALAGYDALGELTATCSPVQVAATPAPCVADGTSDRSWIYHYDAMDHQTKATPPVNVFTALAETITEYDLGGAGHLKKTTQDTRTTTPTYDAAGRPKTTVIVDTAAGTLTTSATLDSLGRTIQVSTTGTSADTLDQAYDAVGRLSSISRSTTNLTSFVYNPDGTASSRTDGTTVNTFTYARLGQLLTATTGPAGSQTYGTYAFGLDGNLLTRTWGSASANPGMTLAYAYDGAKRPIGTSITRAGTGPADAISREYDAAGNVTAETQTFARSGGTGQATAYGGRQSFGYDAANRVETSALTSGSDSIARAYTYDADSNRTSVTDNAVLFFYYYDRTDELVAKNTTGIAPSGSGCATGNFCYDSLGNLLTSWPSASDSRDLVPTSYAYDPAGHLTTITANTTHITAYTIDALGRHASQQVDGAAVVTYSYLGTSQSIVSMTDGTTTTAAAIDAIGNRLASTVGPTTAYLLPDLHGNVVASVSSSSTPAYLSAYRYDAYGQTCGVWSATTGTIAIPWRFQGRILETSATGTDLYDFGARSYDPSLGGFTSFDSVAGSAQNPLTLNRYLYANANPTTMVDPDGHKPVACDGLGLVMGCNDGTTSGHPCDDHVHWCGNTPPPVVSPCLATSTCTPGVPTAPAPPTKPVVPPTLDDTHRQFLIMCLGAGSDLDGCLRRWLKIMHGEAAGDSSSDGPPVIVSTAVGNIDAPASIAKDAVWLAKFKQLYEGFMQRGGGWTAASARAAALAMVRQQFKGGTGAALEGISDKLGAAALLADTGLTMATCDWRDVGNCANQSSKTAVSDYAGLKVGGFVGTACVVGIATGPGDVLICGGAALIAGFVTSNVVGSVWDGVACNFDRDCPKTDDYNEAFRLLTRPDAGKP